MRNFSHFAPNLAQIRRNFSEAVVEIWEMSSWLLATLFGDRHEPVFTAIFAQLLSFVEVRSAFASLLLCLAGSAEFLRSRVLVLHWRLTAHFVSSLFSTAPCSKAWI